MRNKILIKNVFKHLHRINKHKLWVFYYCCKLGIPWRGLVHDLSKYSPTEFWESVRFYEEGVSPITVAKRRQGVSYAWLHHKGRNPHHYEYWIDVVNDSFRSQTSHIPRKYKLEMLADLLAASRTYKDRDVSYEEEYNWWIDRVIPDGMNAELYNTISKWLYLLKENGDDAFKVIRIRYKKSKIVR